MTVGLCCSMQLKDIGALPVCPAVVSASLAVPPWEDDQEISGVGPEGVAIPKFGVTPLVDSGTDLEDELPTPDDSPSTGVVGSEEVVLPGARPAPPDVIDFELEKALLQVSMLTMMVTPIVDPVVALAGDSVFIPGASSSCPADGRTVPCVAGFFTSRGGRTSGPGCLPDLCHVAGWFGG